MARAPNSPPQPAFPGFPAFRSNVTYVPIQFFTVVVPHSLRGTVRIVGYVLRQILGWVNEQGEPTCEQLQFTYRELSERAGVGLERIGEALQEAVKNHFLRCLRTPQPDQAGQAAQSGLYELCWDRTGPYTDNPAEFRGFFHGESALVEEGDGPATVRRAKAARKNIPNVFFDVLLRQERLSVIRVVGALLFYSIRWGDGGERRQPVSYSITQLSRLTRHARRHVHAAIGEAQERGYIETVDAGCFDAAAGQHSRRATYRIRWAPVEPVGQSAATGTATETNPSARPTERAEKGYGEACRKGARDRAEKGYEKRAEKGNGISIKTESKTEQTAAEGAGAMTGAPDFAAAVALLVKQGFDEPAARHLAQQCSLEVIQRQIEWLPFRTATKNRLGLLRKAIEENWLKPEGAARAVPTAGEALARLFAAHYYGAYHGLSGPAQTEPFPKDLQAAGQFVAGLLELRRDENLVPEWGRQFGQLMRAKHQGDPKAKPNLSYALTLYGGLFLSQRQREAAAHRKKALGTAKERHQAAFYVRYEDYLRQTEIALQKADSALYAAYLEHRRETRHRMTGGLLLASADTLAKFDSERSRLLCLAEFLHRHPRYPVLDFWEWDAQLNPQRFGSDQPNRPAGSEEARA